jgi:hypothetical protein
MVREPYLVAGRARVDTAVMETAPGVAVKAGAEGLICAALPDHGLGVALKIADGTGRATGPALIRVLRALGVLDDGTHASLGPAVAATLLERTAEPGREVSVRTLLTMWRELAGAPPETVRPPDRLRVLVGDRTAVVDADRAVVADDPRWLQRGDLGGLVVAPAAAAGALADLLDLPLASELAAGRVDASGSPAAVPVAARDVVPELPEAWREHEELLVDRCAVDWWVDDDGVPHAATADGLARALAWATGRWDRRHLLAAVLAEPGDAVRLAVEAAAG